MSTATPSLPTKLPPGPRGLPVFGSLLKIRNDTHLAIDRVVKRYGDICLVKFGSVPTVIISDADLLHDAFGKAELADRWVSEIMDTLSGQKDLVLAPYGERWRQMQRFANRELLSARNVDNVRELHIEQVVDGLVDRMAGMGDAGELVSPPAMTARTNSTLMFRSIFGQPDDSTDEFQEQREALLEYIGWIFSSATATNLADYIPWLRILPSNAVKEAVRQAEIGSAIIHGLVENARNRTGLDLSAPTCLDPGPGSRGAGPHHRPGCPAHRGGPYPTTLRVCLLGRVNALSHHRPAGTPPQSVGGHRSRRISHTRRISGAGQHLFHSPRFAVLGLPPRVHTRTVPAAG